MRWGSLLLALAFFGCGPSEREPLESQGLAVAGTQDTDQYPMVVGLVIMKGTQVARCSGALIAPNLVLTARHCVSPTSGGLINCGSSPLGAPYPAANTRVTRLPQMTNEPGDYVAASRVEVVPGGNDECGFDLAALVLEGDGFGTDAPVTVPRIDSPASPGETYTAVGYGSTGSGGIGTRRFKSGVKVSCAGTSCAPLPAQESEWIGEDNSFCQADSGAPALDVEGKLIGTVSRGANPCAYPILADTAAWKTWIMELGVSAAKEGGYEASFWALSGVSTPPVKPDAGGKDPQGGPCPCPSGYACYSPDGVATNATCTATCTTDDQCPAGLTCADIGACTPPAQPSRGSESDSGCSVTEKRSPLSPPLGLALTVFGLLVACRTARLR